MPVIHTERLRLDALTERQLELYLADHQGLERDLGMRISKRVVTGRAERAISMKLSKMARVEEKDHPWYTYWLVVVKSEMFGAGLVGFKGRPDGRGEVEIGYGIDPLYQNRGYVTEAARAIVGWAFLEPECLSVIAPNTSKLNPASNRVLEKMGMHVYWETDEALCWRILRGAFPLR